MHESVVTATYNSFHNSVRQLSIHVPSALDHLSLSTGRDIPYASGGGSFGADCSIHANRLPVFHVEVAFTQSFMDVRSKIANILQDDTILGVLLFMIKEKPKYLKPERHPTANDWAPPRQWFTLLNWEPSFSGISLGGIVWVHTIELGVSLFEKGWNINNNDPHMVGYRIYYFQIHLLIKSLVQYTRDRRYRPP
jgi:hypothetical protein